MFEVEKVYNRRDLHRQYGGSSQSGIASCANYPIIFIFSGSSGKSHGYQDSWDEENYYHYTGEGQVGDMTFTRGNKALLNHVKDNKRVFLFENQSKGLWKFIDEVELVDFSRFRTPDNTGRERSGIEFILKSKLGKAVDEQGKPRESINYNKPTTTERKGLVTSRVGQGYYRWQLLDRWESKCAVTHCGLTGILIASHIVPWKGATNEERLDVDNGILLSPNLDALFDKHLISFSDEGTILVSNKVDELTLKNLGIYKGMAIQGLTQGNKKYLQIHRKKFYENN